jgi:uncharacterized Zn ribbon protein
VKHSETIYVDNIEHFHPLCYENWSNRAVVLQREYTIRKELIGTKLEQGYCIGCHT